jgi:Na+-transporting methylmalonyl-CoA/oxaloacetate decarboxylase gamma subunit
VYNNQLTNDNTTTTSTFNNKVDVPSNAIVTPTAALHQESFHEGREGIYLFIYLLIFLIYVLNCINIVENKEQVPAPTPTIADVTPAIIMDNDNKSNSSFVVVRSSTDNHSPTSSSPVNDDLETTNNEELLSIIANLKSQLENEKATVNVLQKQKEGKIHHCYVIPNFLSNSSLSP